MKLRHYTTEDCAEAIRSHGLDPTKSRGKEQCVWLVDDFAAWKLVQHLEALRGVPPAGWVVFTVNVPGSWLVRTPCAGRWKCYRPIPACRCRSLRLERRDRVSRRKDGGPRPRPVLRRKGKWARPVL